MEGRGWRKREEDGEEGERDDETRDLMELRMDEKDLFSLFWIFSLPIFCKQKMNRKERERKKRARE